MNQILDSMLEKNKHMKKKKRNRIFFKIQTIISILIMIVLYGKLLFENYKKSKIDTITKNIEKTLKISEIYNVKEVLKEKEIYFGKIIIPKIDLEYTIFNDFSEELLKISPCKFYGVNIGEKGNICIAGHNYNDNRFFGNLFKLKVGDFINLKTLENKVYLYRIYEIYETNPNDLSCLKNKREYELTLVTCNNANKKRRIIKAVYNE